MSDITMTTGTSGDPNTTSLPVPVGGMALRGIDHAIAGMTVEIGAVPKTHDAPAVMGGWKFRGVEDAIAALRPVQIKFGVNIMPFVEKVLVEVVSGEKPFVLSTVTVRYVLTHAGTGTQRSAKVVGQGVDKADKSVAKAMSNAYKTFVWQTFAVSVDDSVIDSESDVSGFEGTRQPQQRTPAQQPAKPASFPVPTAQVPQPAAQAQQYQAPPQAQAGGNKSFAGITEKMAYRLMAASTQRSNTIGMHGHAIIAHSLRLMGLPVAEGLDNDGLKQHLVKNCPGRPSPAYEKLYDTINGFDPAWATMASPAPAAAPAPPQPVQTGALPFISDDDIPF